MKSSEVTSSVGLLGMWWLAYLAFLCKMAVVCGRLHLVRLVCSCPLLPFPPQCICRPLLHCDEFWRTAHLYAGHMSAGVTGSRIRSKS